VQIRLLHHCLLTRAELGQAFDEAGVLSQVRIPADGETLTLFHH
jgi:hypothetical protein